MQPREDPIGSSPVRRAAELAGSLRGPESGVVGQGVRFALAGGVVTVVYLVTTTVLAEVVGLPFQLALALGFTIAILVHFTLQRAFVWVHHEEFALPIHHQVGRYLLVAGAQYGLTAASTALLPPLLGVPVEAVYLVTVVVLVTSNFLIFRLGIFHAQKSVPVPSADVGPADEQ